MSHRHFCDFAGHYWVCEGVATRLFAPAPSVCVCLNHSVPMESGDHSDCSVELLSCPEHRADQMHAMGYEPGYTKEPEPEDAEPSPMFTDEHGNRTVGFCLWCNKDFYSMDDVEVHNADDMRACPVFHQFQDEDCGPPVLQMMLEQAEKAKNDENDDRTLHRLRSLIFNPLHF
jgi:hypothetical protein